MKREKKRKIFKFLISVSLSLFLLLVTTIFVVRPAVLENFDSMYPTFEKKQFILLNVLNKTKQEFNRFDIICADVNNNKVIKRLIGLPGETINYKDGLLYINGVQTNESYFKNKENMDTPNFSLTLTSKQYLILGDNRRLNDNLYNIIEQSQIISSGILFPMVE